MKYYSQYGQDKYIWENYFKTQLTGTFVEIGAEDGIRFSNTKFFEESGWDGLCIEPRPNAFELLKENRGCKLENCAISDKKGTFKFLSIDGYGKGLSGLIDKYDERHKQRIQSEAKNSKQEIIEVNCFPLNEILDKHDIKNIDYMSIDVEGAEFEVIKTIDFSKYNVKIITIENNYGETEVSEYLKTQGFRKVTKLTIDEVFENEKLATIHNVS